MINDELDGLPLQVHLLLRHPLLATQLPSLAMATGVDTLSVPTNLSAGRPLLNGSLAQATSSSAANATVDTSSFLALQSLSVSTEALAIALVSKQRHFDGDTTARLTLQSTSTCNREHLVF